MKNIAEQLKIIREKISQAEQKYHRKSDTVTLVAASKTRSVAEIAEAVKHGQMHFGENYLQEALPKIEALKNKKIVWHFIGPIQSNKTKLIAENFAWVETIEREKIAQRLNDQRPKNLPPLNVCIEVNLSEETTKSGIGLDEILPLAKKIEIMPHLKLRGLMSIPAPSHNFDEQRKIFRQLAHALQQLNQQGFNLDTLSMGMSDDFEAAIAEGATIVRIGSAIFGSRSK
ncbi:MAG: YggS family pyridoxal phosphate-dependent enzyme [Gammaproteobacteria bacterium]|jgi:pyridoxal phosphate enzyme (YggS family)